MPEYSLNQSQSLRQEQVLAPQQIQSLEILVAPLLQLQEKITQELAENPVLEQEKNAGEELAGDLLSDMSSESIAEKPDDESSEFPAVPEPGDAAHGDAEEDHVGANDADHELDTLMQLADAWENYKAPLNSSNSYSEDDEERRQHLFDSLTEEASLQEQLLEQLRFSEIKDADRKIAEFIIGSIDDNGYLRTHPADIAIASSSELADVERMLVFIQTFDPPGIGARDLKECLLIQLKRKKNKNKLLYDLVNEHLDDISKNRLPQVAKQLKVSVDELNDMIDELRRLNPYPGSAIAPDNPVFVIPEVVVERNENGRFVIVQNDDQFPRIRISPLYVKLLEDPTTPEDTKSYIREKLTNGKMLIKSLEQRQSTIRRIAEIIVNEQQDFLENGIEYLRPMTMQQVADKLDLHETTISRAIANKFIKTPVGLFEFKFFFSGGYQSDSGEEFSSKSVKEKIRDLIDREDPFKPISDDAISKMLQAQGFSVARRTVAKYREEMDIQPSHLRKEF